MEDESMHILMEYAEKGDLYKVKVIIFICIVIERVTQQEEVLFWERPMGFLIPDMLSYRILTQ